MKRWQDWQAESILSRQREDVPMVPLFVVIVGALLVLAPIAIGAAMCAGWWK